MKDRNSLASQIGETALNQTPKAASALRPLHHYSSKDLFGDQSEIVIEHQGAAYRLRITRLGKLILNK